MSDPSMAMQKAINDVLTGDSALDTAMGGVARIFDNVPADPEYPYVRIGQDQANDQATSCFLGWEYFHTLHIFARPIDGLGARPLAKRIGGPLRAALATLEDTVHQGFSVDEFRFRSADYFMERDGITAHGVVVVSFNVTPAS